MEDGDDEDDDVAAGPDLPPDLDEEGRFFGGGITNDTAEVLDFIDGRERDDLMVCFRWPAFQYQSLLSIYNQEPEKIDSAWLRKLALNFEKKISRNVELRAKFEDTPEK